MAVNPAQVLMWMEILTQGALLMERLCSRLKLAAQGQDVTDEELQALKDQTTAALNAWQDAEKFDRPDPTG